MIGVWVLVFLAAWSVLGQLRGSRVHSATAEPRPIAPRGDLFPEEQANINLFREASPSVVYISNIDYVRPMFSFDVFRIPQGTGSGFIWDENGYVVTNFHVIAGAEELEVRLADQSTWSAKVVGFERDKDIAVVKIDAPGEKLTPIKVGMSNDLQVGQKVFAIGNPFGWDQTLTTGIVSALNREIDSMILEGRKIHDVIQTDAAINPGNSGGPLLDSHGRLIGVNTQIASPSGASAGVGFAVPVDTVNRIVPQLIRYGRVIRPALGVELAGDWLSRRLDLPGPFVASVPKGSAADKAGLRGTVVNRRGRIAQLGDVITKIDDRVIRTMDDLYDALERHEIGDEVTVTYVRDGRSETTKVTLQADDASQ
ncbi:MAG: trypsin-like peptidase domain-containing protein [Phycisphaerae bacterium]|nr:trypsin-like peptidase domain-containing protein [Phycisphaerae bacterium]